MLRGSKLGEGTFGIVYSAKSPNSNKQYAVKRNLIDNGTSFIGAAREVDILQKIRNHPNVVNLEKVAFGQPFHEEMFSPLIGIDRKNNRDDQVHFVFPKASYDLHSYIYEIEKNFGKMKKYMTQLLLAVEYLHASSIIHRDVKPSNILIFDNELDILGQSGIAKICDFGLSKPYTYQGVHTPSTVTSWYRPPEITLGFPHYDYKVDIWSLGCVFFETIAKKPYIGNVRDNNDVILSSILKVLPKELPMKRFRELIRANKWRNVKITDKSINRPRLTLENQLGLSLEGQNLFEKEIGSISEFTDLLSHMLEFEWDQRWTASQCLNHPFFNDQRQLIEKMHIDHPLTKISEEPIVIANCIERKWMAQIVTEIFNDRNSLQWYNVRALFQAMDIFDRYLSVMLLHHNKSSNAVESEYKGLLHTKYETKLRFMTCVYLCIKYFSSIHLPIAFESIVSPEFRTPEAKHQAEQFEGGLLKNCLGCNIYRPTLYETADRFGDRLEDRHIRDLIILYTLNPNINGLTPSQLYSHYRSKLQDQAIDALIGPLF